MSVPQFPHLKSQGWYQSSAHKEVLRITRDNEWQEVPSMEPATETLSEQALITASDHRRALKSTHLNEQNQGPPVGQLIKPSESSPSFQ